MGISKNKIRIFKNACNVHVLISGSNFFTKISLQNIGHMKYHISNKFHLHVKKFRLNRIIVIHGLKNLDKVALCGFFVTINQIL